MVKYMHVRRIMWEERQEDFVIDPQGGVTIAYVVDEVNKHIMCSFVKCKDVPTPVPELLARKEDKQLSILQDFQRGIITPFATIGALEKLSQTRTKAQELFSYSKGREAACAKLQAPGGEFDVLDVEHPISDHLADWLATVVWPSGPRSVGYQGDDMGFAIDVIRDTRGRWVSTFEPALDEQIHFSQSEEHPG